MTILNLGTFENTPLEHDPFDFVVAKGVMDTGVLAEVNRDYPEIDLPANFKPEDLSYGPSFRQLLDEVDRPAFKAAIERKFGVNLDGSE